MSKEKPIFDILVTIDRRFVEKSFLKLKKRKNIAVVIMKYIIKCKSSYKKLRFLFLNEIKFKVKKILKKDVSINMDKIITCEFSFIILERLFTGKKPPDETKLNERLSELKDLIEKIFNIMKIINVKHEYIKNIFIACFNISELSNEIKFVNVFLKFSS